jgi:hypothetical protein
MGTVLSFSELPLLCWFWGSHSSSNYEEYRVVGHDVVQQKLQLAEDEGSTFLCAVGEPLWYYMASHPRRCNSSLSLLILTPNIIPDKERSWHRGQAYLLMPTAVNIQNVAQPITTKPTQRSVETCIHVPFTTNYIDTAFISMVTDMNDLMIFKECILLCVKYYIYVSFTCQT